MKKLLIFFSIILGITMLLGFVSAEDEQSVCNFYSDSSCTLFLNDTVGFEISGSSYFLSVESISSNSAMIKIVNQKNTVEYLSYTVGLNSNFSFNNINIRLNEINSNSVKVGISVITPPVNSTPDYGNSACNFYSDSSCTLFLNDNVGFEISGKSYFLSVESISPTYAMIKVVNQKNTVEYLSYTVGLNSNFSFNNINIRLDEIKEFSVKVKISVITSPPVVYSCKDNGEDYYSKGTAYIFYLDADGNEVIPTGGSIEYSQSDLCESENQLREYFCHKDGSIGIGSTNYWCPFGCKDGACLKIKPENNAQPVDMNQKIEDITNVTLKEELKNKLDLTELCQGCVLDKKCYPFGFRKDKNYCSDKDNTFVNQIKADSSCQNNFECDSNICVNNQCVSGSLLQKILNWFSHLFGGK